MLKASLRKQSAWYFYSYRVHRKNSRIFQIFPSLKQKYVLNLSHGNIWSDVSDILAFLRFCCKTADQYLDDRKSMSGIAIVMNSQFSRMFFWTYPFHFLLSIWNSYCMTYRSIVWAVFRYSVRVIWWIPDPGIGNTVEIVIAFLLCVCWGG